MARSAVRPFDLSLESEPSDADSPAQADPVAALGELPRAGGLRSNLELLTAPGQEDLGFAQNAYAVALGAGVVWAATMTAYTLFERGARAGAGGPLWLLIFGAVIALPIAFMLLAAYAIRQGARLAAETKRARAIAGELVGPAALATSGAGDALTTLRNEIGRAAEAAADAGQTLTSLREALKGEADLLTRAAAEANRATARLTTAFVRERQNIADMSATLEGATQGVTDAIARQSNLVVEASDLARAGAEEAQGLIGARTSELSAAVEHAGAAAQDAGAALAGQTERLERAGAFLGERYREMAAALEDRHGALSQLTDTLREEQEHAAALLEGQRSRLAETAVEARASAEVVTAAAQGGASSLRDLEHQAHGHAERLAEAGRAQQEALQRHAEELFAALQAQLAASREAAEAETRQALERLSAAAEQARAAAAQGAASAEQDVEARLVTAEAHLKRLAEVGRLAGEQASQVVNAAIAQASRAAEESAALVEQAGADAERRVNAGLEAARTAVLELSGLLQQVEGRVAALPGAAREQVEAARRAVAQTVQEAIAATREASRLEQARTAAAAAPARPGPPSPSPVRANGAERKTAQPGDGGGPAAARPATPPSVAQPAAPSPPADLESAGLRPRLKLTTAGPPDPAPADGFETDDPDGVILFDRTIRGNGASAETPDAAPIRGTEDWSWTDLLAAEEQAAPARDEDDAADRLIGEIQAMGVDPGALLPLSRIDEITAALNAGNADAARELVSRAAPAAIRRLSRRVLTDKALRAQADKHVRQYQEMVEATTGRDREGHMTSALLSSEPGRTYLLLDAAFRELH